MATAALPTAVDDGTPADVGMALHRLSLGLDRVRAALAAELDLVPIDVNALLELHRRPGIRPGDLARALNLKAAGTTSATDRLVNNGYARRSADATDRRGTRLDLTPAGVHASNWILEHLAAAARPGGPDAASTAGDGGTGQTAGTPASSAATTEMLAALADRLRLGADHAA